MKAYVIGSSALYFWRHALGNRKTLQKRVNHPLGDCHASASELNGLLFPTSRYGPEPIHLMVSSPGKRSIRPCFRFTVHASQLPNDAFCLVEPDICVASPEFCLLLAARVLPPFQLIELAMEMCGMYTLDNEAPRGFIPREHQLTSVTKLKKFAQQMNGKQGVKGLRFALRYAKDHSRSPMETREYILSCLPKQYGSYGLPGPMLNVRIELTFEEQHQAKRKYLEVDMLWKNKRVVIEYDGNEDHSSKEDRGRDAAKRNILIAKGYFVFTVTSRQICDAASFDALVRDIARKLDFRLRDFPPGWTTKRERLRKEVFKSLIEGETGISF